jgi:hypothetical protein
MFGGTSRGRKVVEKLWEEGRISRVETVVFIVIPRTHAS